MIKYFCDYCGDEINSYNDPSNGPDSLGRLTVTLKNGDCKMQLQVITAKENTWNAGQFCKYCILDALYSLDDRPTKTIPA